MTKSIDKRTTVIASDHLCLEQLDPDAVDRTAFAMSIGVSDHEFELPMHAHRRSQLVMALRGGVMCRAEDGLWMVPPGSGVWVPGSMPHSNQVTPNGRICLLFVDPDVPGLPDHCCTLSLTPMVIEMIRHLATLSLETGAEDGHTRRIVDVILGELRRMKVAAHHLPIPDDQTLSLIANRLIRTPDDRASITEWAGRVAMSERTLARLVVRKTGMTFGRWRQQLQLILALQKLAAGATVQSVALDLGYESVSAFVSMFKAAMGKPPARYIADQAGSTQAPITSDATRL